MAKDTSAAARAGARHVVNVDFAESSLAVGKDNARLHELPIRVRFIKSDAFAALRQFAGIGQPKMVRGKHLPPFPELAPHRFDLVFLDPPRYAKSRFGVVDLVHDYAALFKPALLATEEGGTLICCNNVARVRREDWLEQLERRVPVAVFERLRLHAPAGADHEARRHRQADRRHLGKVRPFSAQKVAHIGLAFIIAAAEAVDPFRHDYCLFPWFSG